MRHRGFYPTSAARCGGREQGPASGGGGVFCIDAEDALMWALWVVAWGVNAGMVWSLIEGVF